MKCRNVLLALGASIFSALAAKAQSTAWFPTVSQDWNNSANWDFGLPAPGVTVLFNGNTPTAFTSTVDANFSIAAVQVLNNTGPMMLNEIGGSTLTLASGAGFQDASPNSASVSVNILGTGAGMSVTGGGILNLSGANTYSGATTISSGTLQAGSTTGFSNTSAVTITGSGVLDLNNFSNAIYSLTSASPTSSVTLGTGTLTIGTGFGVNTAFAGVISGSGSIDYNTFGQSITLTGANTYTGPTIIGQGTVQIGNGGTSGSISSLSNVVFESNAQLTLDLTGPVTFPNVISGVGTLEVENGTVTLTGANTYGGVTKVIGGVVDAGSTTALGNQTSLMLTSGALNLSGFNVGVGSITGDSGSLINLGSNTLTIQNDVANTVFAGAITGTGGIHIVVTSNLDLTGNANTFSGGMMINAGNVYADNTNSADSATGTGTVTIGVGGSLTIGNDSATGYITNIPIVNDGIVDFSRTDSISFPNQITGTGGVIVQDGGTITLTGNNTYTGLTNIDVSTLKAGSSTALGSGITALSFNSSGGTLDLNGFNLSVGSIEGGGTGTINLGGNTLTIGGVTGTTTFNGSIVGTGGITLVGPGPVQQYLTNTTNTYTGPTVIGAGATLGLGFSSEEGNIPDTSGVSGAGTLEFYEPSAITFPQVISGSLGVTLVGPGAITLSGINTYTGATTINAGSLVAGSTSAFGNASPVTINGTGELNLNGFSNTIGPLTGSSTSTIVLGGATLTIDPPADPTFAGTISGGSLILTGPGTEILSGVNSVTSTSIGSTSTLQIGDGSTSGESITGNISNAGTLVFAPASTDNVTYSGVVSGPGAVTIQGSSTGIINLSGSNTYSGLTSVNSGVLADAAANSFSPTSNMLVNSAGGSLSVGFNETVGNLENGGAGGPVYIALGAVLSSLGNAYGGDFGGTVSGGGSIAVIGGQQGFNGNNAFTGGVSVTNGELWVGSNTALGTGTLTFNANAEMSPDASVTLANNVVLNGTFDNDDGGSNNLTLTGLISGPGEIEWCTTGTIVLTNGNNSFTGGIDMRAGTLVVNSTGATGSALSTITLDTNTTLNVGTGVAVSNPLNFTGSGGIVLTGNGTIASPVTVSAAETVAPAQSSGGGPGNLTFSDGLNIATGGTIQFDLYDANGVAGTGYSLITATGGLTLSSSANSLNFNLVSVNSTGNPANAINFNSGSSYQWMFATSSTAITGFNAGAFNLVTSGFSNSTGSGVFSFAEVGDNLYLNFTPVPEPSTWALMGTGLVAILLPVALRRRRLARI
jgi:fibronectin-binding autotransporter adhesin